MYLPSEGPALLRYLPLPPLLGLGGTRTPFLWGDAGYLVNKVPFQAWPFTGGSSPGTLNYLLGALQPLNYLLGALQQGAKPLS